MRRVAVITGAGSGIGRALALACGERGMDIVAADIEASALRQTQQLLQARGVACHVQVCDVSSQAAVQALADASWATFGRVDWLFNNAGVAVLGPVWQATLDDWAWVLNVNLMGVVHGLRAFVPRMLQVGGPAHVINTASAAGLATVAGSGVYCASKHAVVALSECLRLDLRAAGASIGTTVLCPGLVASGIADSGRNRPPQWAQTFEAAPAYDQRVRRGMAESPISAADVATATLQAIDRGSFYVLPHGTTWASVQRRLHAVGEDHQRGLAAKETDEPR